jgi:hypothetical protein
MQHSQARGQDDDLEQLLRKARRVEMSDEEKTEQRRSFAYGNSAFENPNITREMIREQDEQLVRE